MLDYISRPAPRRFRDVLAFSFNPLGPGKKQRVALIATGVLLMTLADVLLPVYVGQLIDALCAPPCRARPTAAKRCAEAIHCPRPPWSGLGALMLVMRHLAFHRRSAG
jgi:hypothetical protein